MSRRLCFVIDVQPKRTSTNELPALAFGSHYSVFKERPGTHHYCRCWCRVFRRTVPDALQVPESLLQMPEGLGGPFRRECHLTRVVRDRQRVRTSQSPRRCPGPTSASMLAAWSSEAADTHRHRPGLGPSERPTLQTELTGTDQGFPRLKTPKGGIRGTTPVPRMPPGVRGTTGFPLPPCANPEPPFGSVRRPLIHLDLPHVIHVRIRIMRPRCCTAVTTR